MRHGAPQPPLARRGVRRTIRVDGVEDPPSRGWPVVLSFHGWCMTATQQADDDGLRKPSRSTAREGDEGRQYAESFNGGGSAREAALAA